MFKLLLFLLSTFAVASCGKMLESQIAGRYGSDKFALRDTSLKIEAYPLLLLNPDKSFELKRHNSPDKMVGSWKIIGLANEDEATLEFSFSDKTISASVRKTIIYFTYPNDFYNGKFESLIYVRLVR